MKHPSEGSAYPSNFETIAQAETEALENVAALQARGFELTLGEIFKIYEDAEFARNELNTATNPNWGY